MPSQDLELIVSIFLFTTVYSLCFAQMSTPHLPLSDGWGLQKFQQFLNIERNVVGTGPKSSTFRLKILCSCSCGFHGSPRWGGNLKFRGFGEYLVQGSAVHELCQY